MVRWKASQCTLELIPDADRREAVRHGCVVVESERDLDDLTPPVALRSPIAGPNEQAVEPRVQTIRIAQTTDVPPCLDQGVLDGVFRTIGVAQDQPGRGVQPRDDAVHERPESLVITLLRPLHELVSHPADPLDVGPLRGLAWYGVSQGSRGSIFGPASRRSFAAVRRVIMESGGLVVGPTCR